MLKFDFKKSSRKCFESEREFQPGEEFYSALFEGDDGSTERRDFSTDHWKGPIENTIGWWKSSVPELGKGRIYWAPKKVLLSYFEHVLGNPKTADVAFVTGLLLVQKRILYLQDDGGDESRLVLLNRTDKTTFEVPVLDIEPKRLAAIQEELSDKLFMDQPVSPEDDIEATEEVND